MQGVKLLSTVGSSSNPQLGVRMTSTSAGVAKPDPTAAAASLIDSLPGDSPAAKTSWFLIGASIATWIISKEIYIVDGEFFEMVCIFGAYYIWYSNGKDAAMAYFKDRKDTIARVLNQAREDHKAVVKERIAHIGKLSDAVEVTKSLFEQSKEIAKLEAEAYQLKQKVAYSTEIKSVLDSWVRHETSVRDQQQKRLVSHVIEKVKADLADPKNQQLILSESINEIERLAARR